MSIEDKKAFVRSTRAPFWQAMGGSGLPEMPVSTDRFPPTTPPGLTGTLPSAINVGIAIGEYGGVRWLSSVGHKPSELCEPLTDEK